MGIKEFIFVSKRNLHKIISFFALFLLTYLQFSNYISVLGVKETFAQETTITDNSATLTPSPTENKILIKSATLLDKNNHEIGDITKQVDSRDNIYATIDDGQYIKVLFEKPLDSLKDITIYAKSLIENQSSSIEVYPQGTDIPLTSFKKITKSGEYKVYLDKIKTPTDTFFLKVSGTIQIDLITDPFTWTEKSGSGSRNWYSITSSSDGTKLAAVVNGGYIYTSTDSGATWTQKTTDATRAWYSITSSSDGTKLAAVVNGGYIYTSTDSGATWTQKTTDATRAWRSITSSSDGTKLAAVVYTGYIYTSTDSGATWTQKTTDATRAWYSITSSSDGTKLAAVVYNGYIYTSTDSGVTWTPQTSAGSRSWRSITSSSDGTKLAAVVQSGYIYTSTNSGVTWTQQTSPGYRNWFSITSSSDGTKLAAVVIGGYIYSAVEEDLVAYPANISNPLWTNSATTPYFFWTAAADGGSGTRAYCLYLGTDSTADPTTTKGVLGTTDSSTTGTTCQFVTTNTSIDFSNPAYRGSPWPSNSTTINYLRIRAIDNAGNYSDDIATFSFGVDTDIPTNPSLLSLPSSYVGTKSATICWSTSCGADQATDTTSGVAGYQYRIGTTGIWYGSSHSGTQSVDDIVTATTYTFQQTPDFANLPDNGTTKIYLRTLDYAGNTSPAIPSDGAILKINTTAPFPPSNLTVTATTPKDADPATSDINAYAFSWDLPTFFAGQSSNLTYCYTINTSPSMDTCHWTSAGATSLPADAFATQPGKNTLYIVAKDEAGNVSYDATSSVYFYYSGSAPGIPRNIEASDISIKATSNWKLTVSWDIPSDTGAGVASYKVYRSTVSGVCASDDSNFSFLGSTAGTSYTDTGLTQKTHYYCVKACDSANNCSAYSSTVSLIPMGKYYVAAGLVTGPDSNSITTRKATITWSTDRSSDSKVQYGTTSNSYNIEEPSNSSQITSHTINLTGLNPGTPYYYRAKWTDEDGNTGTSEEKTFTTTPAPTVKDVSAKNIGLASAIIQFTTNNASKVKIYYGTTTSFGGLKEIATSTNETTYTTELISLLDGTKYYYKINTYDSDGVEYDGTVLDFTTLPRPRISNVRIEQVANTAQSTILVSWTTNTEVSSIVTYYPQSDSQAVRDEVNIALTKGEHQMIVRGLIPETNYQLIVRGRDKIGNEASSDIQQFTTATDTRPPQIAELHVEGSNVPPSTSTGQESTTQLIISWYTDEPATSQVEFGEGTGETYSSKTVEDSNLTVNHLVIISNLTPSKVYHLKAISNDKAGNIGYSIDTVTITPKATDNALDLVISNLQSAFGFGGN